jgi:DNA invertase Pin-like site-specific DNA recombinase
MISKKLKPRYPTSGSRAARAELSERVHAGLARARKQGRIGGRPRLVVDRRRVSDMPAAGKTRAEIAEALGLSTRTVSRLWAENSARSIGMGVASRAD